MSEEIGGIKSPREVVARGGQGTFFSSKLEEMALSILTGGLSELIFGLLLPTTMATAV